MEMANAAYSQMLENTAPFDCYHARYHIINALISNRKKSNEFPKLNNLKSKPIMLSAGQIFGK